MHPDPSIAACFLAAVDAARRADFADDPELGVVLAATLREVRAEVADVEVPDEVFVAWLARRVPAGAAIREALRALHTADLYLACGLAHGDRVALTRWERDHLAEVRGVVRGRGHPPAEVEELIQALRAQLLAGGPDGAGIGGYAGRGKLRSWLLVTALRAALKRAHRQEREVAMEHEHLFELVSAAGDLEFDLLKHDYRAAFREAFARALAGLPARSRTLLRLQVFDGLGIDRIGALYGVHRATAARWLERARGTLLADTRRYLTTSLRVDGEEFDSIFRMIASRLDVSLERLLDSAPGHG